MERIRKLTIIVCFVRFFERRISPYKCEHKLQGLTPFLILTERRSVPLGGFEYGPKALLMFFFFLVYRKKTRLYRNIKGLPYFSEYLHLVSRVSDWKNALKNSFEDRLQFSRAFYLKIVRLQHAKDQ